MNDKKNLVTVIGNRPQFIKMTPVNIELENRGIEQTIIHTGQHYDYEMNEIFFEELNIRKPDIQVSLNSNLHGAMTGELLEKLEKIFLELNPKGVLIYGDTNSTLAAALAAVKLGIPIAHIESGPRLGNLETPEEVNRIVADHISTLRFVSDDPSKSNLEMEGITSGVIYSGDVMYDLFLKYERKFNLTNKSKRKIVYMTLHRPQNVDSRECHMQIIDFIKNSDVDVVFPMHKRTLNMIDKLDLADEYSSIDNFKISGPIGYLESVKTILSADYVITDSGGVQKEAFFAKKLSMLMLPQTPWPQLRDSGWQYLAGWVSENKMLTKFNEIRETEIPNQAPSYFGKGNSASIIVDALIEHNFTS